MSSIVNPLPSLARVAGALLGFAALLAAMILTATPASAHARLEVTSPKDGASLTAAPPEVMMQFNEPIQEGLDRVTVTSGSKDATQGPLQVEGKRVYQPLKTSLTPGSYKVTYKVVSKDGHPVSGSFSFAYDPPEGNTSGGSDPAAPSESSASGSAVPAPSEPDSGDPSSTDSPTGTSSPRATTTPSDGEAAQEEPSETSATTTDPGAEDEEADDADDEESTSWLTWAGAAAVIVVVASGIGLVVRARRTRGDEEEITFEDGRE